jgi:hypothetical protein
LKIVTTTNNNYVEGNYDTVSTHFRNPIWFECIGCASTDQFRVEVKISYEFIPTLGFKIWSDTDSPRASN